MNINVKWASEPFRQDTKVLCLLADKMKYVSERKKYLSKDSHAPLKDI